MPFCHACKSSKCRLHTIVNNYELYLCDNCGLLFTSLEKSNRKKIVHQIYTESYVKNYQKLLPKFYKRFERLKIVIESIKEGGKLLDVGCGTGYFLQYLNETSRVWVTCGLEPNATLRKLTAKNIGIHVVNGNLSRIPYPDNSFDVVTCLDVLEHSESLNTNIKELHRVIRKGGILLIQAPNYQSVMAKLTGATWDWWSPPDHVLHFTPYFLTKYLADNTFKVLKCFTYEDPEDYFMNIKGVFRRNMLTKVLYMAALPFLWVAEHIGWSMNAGGLVVVVAEKL